MFHIQIWSVFFCRQKICFSPIVHLFGAPSFDISTVVYQHISQLPCQVHLRDTMMSLQGVWCSRGYLAVWTCHGATFQSHVFLSVHGTAEFVIAVLEHALRFTVAELCSLQVHVAEYRCNSPPDVFKFYNRIQFHTSCSVVTFAVGSKAPRILSSSFGVFCAWP